MFERYSEQARKVVFMARWAAGKRGASAIEPKDLLVALIREERGQFLAAASEILATEPPPGPQSRAQRRLFSAQQAGNVLAALEGPPQGAPVPGEQDMPISPDLIATLEAAAGIADRHDHRTVGPLHLLGALVQDGQSRLARLLAQNGITSEKVSGALGSTRQD